ncbi:hypothetical protein D3C76_1606640 [compost metagenome]
MNDSAPVNAVGSFWIAPYNNTYITPVCTMPSVTRLAHSPGACGSAEKCANGASNSTPVLT